MNHDVKRGTDNNGETTSARWWPWHHPSLINALPRDRALLLPSSPLRKLIVMVDADLSNPPYHDDKTKYLLLLVGDEAVEKHLYGDIAANTPAPGWVHVSPGKQEHQRTITIVRDGEPVSKMATVTDSAFTRVIESQGLAGDVADDGATVQKRADATASLTAKVIQADVFVTRRPRLHHLGHDPNSPVTVMRPEEAIPLIGLYLRQQRRFIVGAATDTAHGHYPVRADFYWHAAENLLPATWGWKTACQAAGGEQLSHLIDSLIQRLDQTLRSRDRLLAALSVRQDADSMADALSELDQILVWLMAAFDVTARVAHISLNIEGSFNNAGWHKPKWVKKLARVEHSLGGLISEPSDGWHFLRLLSSLRNWIHGPALSAAGRIPLVGENRLETLVKLPEEDRAKVMGAMEVLGGEDAWGIVDPLANDGFYIQPGEFVERALLHALTLLNQLIFETPVDRLPGVNASRDQLFPSPPRTLPEKRALWQLGLNAP